MNTFLLLLTLVQPAPNHLETTTTPTQAGQFWVHLWYQLPGNPDSVLTSVTIGANIVTGHRLPASVLRDSFALEQPAPGLTITGQACAMSKRRGQTSPASCAPWSFTAGDIPPPAPLLDSVWTSAGAAPDTGILFVADFAGGLRPVPQNGFAFTGGSCSPQDATDPPAGQTVCPYIVPAPGSISGFAMRFRFVGNTNPDDDGWSEQNFRTPPVPEIFACLEGKIPANYIHRAVSPANNKLFRVWGGWTVTASRDSSYQHSVVKAGSSTLPYNPSAPRSQVIAEFGTSESGTGQWGTGSWLELFKAGDTFRLGFYAKVGTTAKTGAPTNSSMTGAPNDGVIKMWYNGRVVYDRSDLRIFTPGAPNLFTWGYLFGWSNSGFTETTDILLYRLRFSRLPLQRCIT